LESRATEKGAKKLVRSDFAKILEKERKLCLLSLIQIKLQILLLLLSNEDVAKSQNVNLGTLDCQIVSKNLAISVCRTPSDDLAILEAKSLAIKMTLSDAGDVMLTSSSQR
jgi:hypothetical protein